LPKWRWSKVSVSIFSSASARAAHFTARPYPLGSCRASRPRDKRTDYAAAAKAARERGMNRLAERLDNAK